MGSCTTTHQRQGAQRAQEKPGFKRSRAHSRIRADLPELQESHPSCQLTPATLRPQAAPLTLVYSSSFCTASTPTRASEWPEKYLRTFDRIFSLDKVEIEREWIDASLCSAVHDHVHAPSKGILEGRRAESRIYRNFGVRNSARLLHDCSPTKDQHIVEEPDAVVAGKPALAFYTHTSPCRGRCPSGLRESPASKAASFPCTESSRRQCR